MAFQLAYYKQNGKCDSTYESAMTKQFLHGRTETIRSVTNDSIAFTKTWASSSASKDDKIAALRQAIDTHIKIATDCKNGKGVDRHLYGLYNLARHNQQKLPKYEFPQIFKV